MEKEGWSGLARGEDRCAACARAFEGEEVCFSALFAAEESFRRRDYCAACFHALPDRPATFWKRAPRKAAERADEKARGARRRRDLEALSELFDRLSAPEPAEAAGTASATAKDEREKLRYLLALALVRKRRLELVELARDGGADCLVLRASGTAELLTVPAPRLSEEDLARLSRELEAEVGLA